MAPTTPTASRHTLLAVNWPVRAETSSPRSRSHWYSSMSLAGWVSPPARGASSCGPWVTMRGQPTSRMSSSRSCSCSASSACWSCSRQRLRKAWLVDQSVSSNARRAASMALSMSPLSASATSPSTSSVAGLTLANVLPDAASTSLPSMSIFGSKVMSPGTATAISSQPLSAGRYLTLTSQSTLPYRRPMELQGRVAIVTGGAGGLGSVTAHRLAGLGMAVVVFDRDGDRAVEVAKELDGDAVGVGGDTTERRGRHRRHRRGALARARRGAGQRGRRRRGWRAHRRARRGRRTTRRRSCRPWR